MRGGGGYMCNYNILYCICEYACIDIRFPFSNLYIPYSISQTPFHIEMETSNHSGGEEESELSMLIGTPQTTYPVSQSLEDSQSSVEFDSLYQSGGLEEPGQFGN